MRMETIRVGLLCVLGSAWTASILPAQTADPGRKIFEARCATCHGGDGNGGEMGPPLPERLGTRDAEQLAKLIQEGIPLKGMPPTKIGDGETADLIKFLRTIERRPETAPIVRL